VWQSTDEATDAQSIDRLNGDYAIEAPLIC
jgi:hypothetical protein